MNMRMKFLAQFVHVKVENTQTRFTSSYKRGEIITCPIAHFEGNYYADQETVKKLEGEGRVIFRYCDAAGRVDHAIEECNPNGSLNSIAGISSAGGNVIGLMPHPERAVEQMVGFIGADSGLGVFQAALAS